MEWQLDNQILAEFTWAQRGDPLVPIDDYDTADRLDYALNYPDDSVYDDGFHSPILNLYSCPSRTLGDNSLLDLAYFEPWRKCGKELKEVNEYSQTL